MNTPKTKDLSQFNQDHLLPEYSGNLHILKGIRTQESIPPPLQVDALINPIHKGSLNDSNDIESKASASAQRIKDEFGIE